MSGGRDVLAAGRGLGEIQPPRGGETHQKRLLDPPTEANRLHQAADGKAYKEI